MDMNWLEIGEFCMSENNEVHCRAVGLGGRNYFKIELAKSVVANVWL